MSHVAGQTILSGLDLDRERHSKAQSQLGAPTTAFEVCGQCPPVRVSCPLVRLGVPGSQVGMGSAIVSTERSLLSRRAAAGHERDWLRSQRSLRPSRLRRGDRRLQRRWPAAAGRLSANASLRGDEHHPWPRSTCSVSTVTTDLQYMGRAVGCA